MLREVALRRAIEDARGRRAQELEELVHRQGALRRRLRELQDRLLALGTVHGRFAKPEEPPPEAAAGFGVTPGITPPSIPAIEPLPTDTAPPSTDAPRTPADLRVLLAPPKRDAETHAPLLKSLASHHPDGFTVSQMRDVMDFSDPERPHSYDAAWTLANALLRSQTLELAGTRPGPSGVPIRVYRVPQAAVPPAGVS